MRKGSIYILGILSILPLLLNVMVLVWIANILMQGTGNPATSRSAFLLFTTLFIGTGIAQIAIAVLFAYCFLMNGTLSNQQKVFWLIMFLVAGLFTLPLFWLKHVKPMTNVPEKRIS